MIQVKDITFSHAGEPLYEEASFSLPKNRKAGLVGLNGSGKSTLFRLLLGEEWPEDGTVKVEGKVLLVPQEVSNDPVQKRSETVREYLTKAKPLGDDKLEELLDRMELTQVSLDDKPSKLSGGQKTRLAILFAVLSEPEVLLLDEPTNFLDTAGKKWVMHWLARYKKTLVVVSHDLDLLDRNIDKVIYINKQTRKFEEYTGTYSKFKKLKADRDEHLTRYIKNQEKQIARMKKSVEGLRRSNVEKVIRQRVQLEKRIQRIADKLPQLPEEVVRIKIQLPEPAHIGSLPLRVSGMGKAYGKAEVLREVSFSIERRQRVALIGHNGAGKSTLIKIIMGFLEPTRGTVEVDERAKIGYYSQEFESFDLNKELFETVRDKTPASDGQIRAFLAKFMFRNEMLKQRVGSLSGGEKTRLAIALLMLDNYNFLILDEPTTYLDVLSQKIILVALKAYTGTMLVVSHTREFVEELKPDRAFLLPEEKLMYWENSLLNRTVEM
jgi:ATP-binding cassette, subfamily F, member 3